MNAYPLLGRLIITGSINHYPTLVNYLTHHLPVGVPPSLSFPLSSFHFPLFPTSTTFLFTLLFRCSPLHPLPLFSFLLRFSSPLNHFTFPPLLKSLSSFSDGPPIHAQLLLRGFHSNLHTLNSLISFYSRFNLMPQARSLFDSSLPLLDTVSWNILLNGYVKSGSLDIARNLFDEMPVKNSDSLGAIVAGYIGTGDLDIARGLLDEIPISPNLVTWNSIITGFCHHGLLGLARKYFNDLTEKNLVTWNAMVSGYAMNGQMTKAKELFDSMNIKDVVTWTCMISGYAQSGFYTDSIRCFNSMIKEGKVRPNEITLTSALSACAHLSALDQGRWIHRYVNEKRMVLDDHRNLGAALIDMYFKCGDKDEAVDVFYSLRRKNVSSWNALITGLAVNGYAREAVSVFEEAVNSGTEVNSITILGVLTACAHGGLVEEGREYFKNMHKKYGIKAEKKHYGCMVDLLGKAGLLEEAVEIVKDMPMKADEVILGAVLGACQIHRNLEVAERVRKEFLQLKSQKAAGCHFLMSNIYIAADKWTEAMQIRDVMKEKGIKKQAGSSFVELNL